VSVRKKITDAAIGGFGLAMGQAAFDRLKEELFGEDEPEDPKVAEEQRKQVEAEAKRRAKEAEKAEKQAREEKNRAAARLEKEVDRDLAALKKKLGK